MMHVMAARLFILIAITVHALAGWGGASLTTIADRVAVTMSDADACGGSCCCPPKACPCVHAPERNDPDPMPATPPRSERPEIPKIAPSMRGAGLSGATFENSAICAIEGPLTGRPMGDLARRVQQLQCVWRT